MYALLRPLLFALPAETAHNLSIGALAQISRSRGLCALLKICHASAHTPLPHRVMGIDFPSPVGVAAGLDKHAVCANALRAMGFGWVEVGTVTPQPQPGNPRPRMFRLAGDNAIINRMGFNSVGLEAFLHNLARAHAGLIIGVNIGKNATTPLTQAVEDYLNGLEKAYPHAAYIAINVSSPNTEKLRELQGKDPLRKLLAGLSQKREALSDLHGRRVPLVLKISPDLATPDLHNIANLAQQFQIDGIAATNTTVARTGVSGRYAHQIGGLSGAPLAQLATETIAQLYANLQGEIPIIGVGGVDSPARALEKFQAGAELLQLYTGFIYRGGKLLVDIARRLRTECGGESVAQWLQRVRQP